MQAYATTETAPSAQLRVVEHPSSPAVTGGPGAIQGNVILDELLGHLADLVADRLAARLVMPRPESGDEWFDTRRAADYLGIGRDSLRRLAAEGSIPTEQAGVGCKLYFRRTDLDEWRCSGPAPLTVIGGRRDG